jgi:hypothetical protein
MKTFVVPRLDAAALKALSHARAARRRRAERTTRAASMFWLLHAR